jgi:unsaturated rhamnogalacturonyl hydrolase
MKGLNEIYNRRFLFIRTLVILSVLLIGWEYSSTIELPAKEETLRTMELANAYFMKKWPDVGKPILTDRERTSNIWTRAVYYEGLMALYELDPKPQYYDYAVKWGEYHGWNLRDGFTYTRDADNQCAGQTYIDLYLIDQKPERIKYIKMSVDSMLKTSKIDDWHWIDALQMAMPVFARLGALYSDSTYFDRMFKMYLCTKDSIGGGLYNYNDKLWWRDAGFKPPYSEPNGKNCYWSRGNGWVLAAVARALNWLPENNKYREELLGTFREMADALMKVQRNDGFWNVSLHDPDHFGGKETTGTALFTYGIAWGINHEILDEKTYKPLVSMAWNALIKDALHDDGFIGYVQGTGSKPEDGQPIAYDHEPNFEDYGLGCFLLAGSEVYKMSK